MSGETEARPFYLTAGGGQLRLFGAGAGADLVALAGPLRAAGQLARTLAADAPGWRVTAIELPGIGGSAAHPVLTPEEIGRALAAAIEELGLRHFVLAGFDLANAFLAPTLAALKQAPAATFAVGLDQARALARHRLAPPPLAPRSDGTHLSALWTFLRDRHVLEPDDPSQASASGDPLPSPDELAETFVAAAVDPGRFAEFWRAALDALGAAEKANATRLGLVADLPAALGAPAAMPKSPAPIPRATPPHTDALWHDEVVTPRGRMHLRRAGSEGRPLLVIPTGGGSSAQFAPVVQGLARGRQVFSVDYLGNGLSEKPRREVSIEVLAQDMAALIEAMGFAEIDVWGSHTGALVALELAIRHPQKVGRAVLEGPVFIAADFQHDLLANYFPSFAPDKWGLHLARAFHWRRDMFLFWPWYRDRRDSVRRLGLPSPQALHDYAIGILESGEGYGDAYAAAFRYDTRSRMPLLRRPALVCAGPNDMLINGLAETRKLAVPGIEVALTPTTLWWPDPEPAAAAETLALYERFLSA